MGSSSTPFATFNRAMAAGTRKGSTKRKPRKRKQADAAIATAAPPGALSPKPTRDISSSSSMTNLNTLKGVKIYGVRFSNVATLKDRGFFIPGEELSNTLVKMKATRLLGKSPTDLEFELWLIRTLHEMAKNPSFFQGSRSAPYRIMTLEIPVTDKFPPPSPQDMKEFGDYISRCHFDDKEWIEFRKEADEKDQLDENMSKQVLVNSEKATVQRLVWMYLYDALMAQLRGSAAAGPAPTKRVRYELNMLPPTKKIGVRLLR